MKTSRRNFLSTAAMAGGASVTIPLSSCGSGNSSETSYADYTQLDLARSKPVLKRELFPDPVIIETLELLQDRNNYLCRVRSRDGAEGISVGHPNIAAHAYPMFKSNLHHRYVGKDARDLDRLVYESVEGSIKRQGVPLCVHIAAIEFAILDMLGNIANLPVGKLIGEIHNPEISVYLGTRYVELRNMEPEASLDLVQQDFEETRAKAIKIRAGRGDNLGLDNDNAPGQTEKLIKMAREKFGDEILSVLTRNS